MLTPTAAKELGRAFRFFRHAGNLSLRDVAKRAGLSAQYVQNIERGEKFNASTDVFTRLARGYELPAAVIDNLVLKAEVMSALERRGLDQESAEFIWRGVEQRLGEKGVEYRTDLVEVVSTMIG